LTEYQTIIIIEYDGPGTNRRIHFDQRRATGRSGSTQS
jgi:hypothetical protein